ncbi:hypothetical protein ACKI2N_014560 [Cupriavidus sp. 30B13]|uniref:hypothetical protein n=1 Tax=Cupriavidus sp. 30B13 TaxID=3384241 RepID=UPI003B92209B
MSSNSVARTLAALIVAATLAACGADDSDAPAAAPLDPGAEQPAKPAPDKRCAP